MLVAEISRCIQLVAVCSALLHAASAALIDVKLRCERENIRANFVFDEVFHGVLFAKNFFDRDECKIIGKGEKELALILPLITEQSDARFCGAKSKCTPKLVRFNRFVNSKNLKNNVVSLKLVFSSAQHILVAGAREIELQCEYRFTPITVTAPNGALNIRPNSEPLPVIIGHQLRDDPAISMLIREGHSIDGPPVADAGIGQNITLDIFSESLDFYVHDCFAYSEKQDGQNRSDSEPNIRFIDEKGCLIEEQKISEGAVRKIVDEKELKHAYLYLHGFQFHNSQSVHFECQVRPCMNGRCTEENCQNVEAIVANAVEVQLKSQKIAAEKNMANSDTENASWLDKVFHDTEEQRYLLSGRQKDSSFLEPIIRTMNGSLILREEEEVSLEASLQMKPRNVVVEASAALLSGSDSRNESELEEAPLNIRPSRPFMLEEASLLPAGSMALASVFLTAMVCLFGVVVFWYCRKLRAEEGRRHKVTMTVDTKQLVFHNVDNSAQK